ncbi:YjeF N-terminal domain-containing protein [Phycomyces blakesleeanus]
MSASVNQAVRIELKSNQTLVGIISAVDAEKGSISLERVLVRHSNEYIEQLKNVVLARSNAKSITVIDTPSVSSLVNIDLSPVKQSPTMSDSSPNNLSRPFTKAPKVKESPAEFVDPAIVSMISSASVSPQIPVQEKKSYPEPKKTALSPSSLPSLPLFGSQMSRGEKKLLETVIYSDYRDFVKYRGRNGVRLTDNDDTEGSKDYVEQKSPKPQQQQKQKNNEISPKQSVKNKTTSTVEMMDYNEIDDIEMKDAPESVDTQATTTLLASLRLSSTSTDPSTSRKSSQSPPAIAFNSLVPPKVRARGSFQSFPVPKDQTPSPQTAKHSLNVSPTLVSHPSSSPSPSSSSSSPSPDSPDSPMLDQQKIVPDDDKRFRNNGLGIKTVAGGILCPVVTPTEMKKVEEICEAKVGPNTKMMVENAGYGASMMALKAIGGQRRIQPNNHNAAPLIVILAGNNTVGSYSLAAARHLVNRACQVVVFLACSNNVALVKEVEEQKLYCSFAEVNIIDDITQLPQQFTTPVDLIIDGLMGCQSTLKDLRGDYETRELLRGSMDWANANKAPVLSLDFPSGVNGIDGLPFHVMHYIKPKWTLCFGAPKIGCTSRAVTGELFLADIGIPPVAWEELTGNRYTIPWGSDFILALEYDHPSAAEAR